MGAIKGLSKNQGEKCSILPFVYKGKNVELVHVAEAIPRSYDALDNLRLSDLEVFLLGMLGKYIVISHSVAYAYLKNQEFSYQDVVKACRKLMILELVNAYRWKREGDVYESPWIYTLSNNGVHILKKRSNTTKYLTTLKTEFIKDRIHILMGSLITNSLVLYLQNLSIHRGSYIRPLLKWEEVGQQRQFMPQAVINLLQLRTQQEFSVLVEPIRRHKNWKEEIDAKLMKYSFFYINESYKKCNILRGKPVIMLILEDVKHMEELAKHVALTPNEGFFKKNNVLITTDWDIRDIEELNLYKGVYKIVFDDNEINPKYNYVNFLG